MKTSSQSPSFSTKTNQARGQVGKLLFRPEGWSPPLPRCEWCATAAIPGLCPAARRPATDELEREDATSGATAGKKRRTAFKPSAGDDCFVPIDKPLIEIVVETERSPPEAEKTGDVEMKEVGDGSTKERVLLRRESGDVEMFFPGELCW